MVHINGATNVGEILSRYPETRHIFRKYGIPFNG